MNHVKDLGRELSREMKQLASAKVLRHNVCKDQKEAEYLTLEREPGQTPPLGTIWALA